MEKEAFFPHYLCQFPESQRVHSFKSAPYALARPWAMPSFQQQLSHRHRGEAPLGRPITLHCGDCAVQLLGGARSKASGGCMAMGFSLDSGLAVPWPELQEVINHPPASRGRLGQQCGPCLTCALCRRQTTPGEWR